MIRKPRKNRDHWPYRTELMEAAREFAVFMLIAAIAGILVGLGIATIFFMYAMQ